MDSGSNLRIEGPCWCFGIAEENVKGMKSWRQAIPIDIGGPRRDRARISLASRAPASNIAKKITSGAYFQYHQHQP